jgi:transposase-like protein
MADEEVEKTAQQIEQRWRQHYEKAQRPRQCIYCGDTRVNFDGSRKRSASVWVLTVVVYLAELLCRRVKCAACHKSWTLRPPELVAHKHFQPCVAARAVSRYLFEPDGTLTRVASEHSCSRQTVKRWLNWTAAIAEPATLLCKVVEAADAPVVLPVREVGQAGRKARNALGRELLARAAEVLALMESLCSAWSLEPPGLRAVLRRVIGERSGIGTYARPVIPELVRGAG